MLNLHLIMPVCEWVGDLHAPSHRACMPRGDRFPCVTVCSVIQLIKSNDFENTLREKLRRQCLSYSHLSSFT